MRLFKTRWLARFTRRQRIADSALREAISRAERGLIDADLGGGLIKQRVARPNDGRRGGYRMMVGTRQAIGPCSSLVSPRAILTISRTSSWRELRLAGQLILSADAAAIEGELKSGNLLEIENDQENEGRERGAR